MTAGSIKSLERLIRIRRVRMEQARRRFAEAEAKTRDAEKQVTDTRGLLEDYALARLPPQSSRSTVTTQHRFAGKVNELLQNRVQQMNRVAAEQDRRRQVLGAAHTELLIAEKLTALRSADLVNQESRKLRRRSIHRLNRSGTVEHEAAKE